MRAVLATNSSPCPSANGATPRSAHTSTDRSGPRAPTRRLRGAAEVAVVQATEHFARGHGANGRRLDGGRLRGVLGEREVGAAAVVVRDVLPQQTGSVCLSPRTMTLSNSSRRSVPMTRSQYGFCQGERGAESTCSMPMALSVPVTTLP